jgi:hypothetical protein
LKCIHFPVYPFPISSPVTDVFESGVAGVPYPGLVTYFDLTGFENRRQSTVGSFLANLPEFLGAMAVDPRTILAIAEFGDGRYWQCWADQDSTIVLEVISNLNISHGAIALSQSDEQKLRDIGFMEPSAGPNPNWRIEASGVGDLSRLVAVTYAAVQEVLGEAPPNVVDVRTWEFKRPDQCTRDEVRKTSRLYMRSQKGLDLQFLGDE